ncbi:putative oxidoreductase GLYR1 homolog isoform X4 [Plutella xylostella]|uniref:putative oxidoreductase GLYR1 homolog isoform X3 n=1 Tax=Plutella xylostella TaxID=51655 RepID=UPI0018D16D1E|nr:putative oxidoreductase GLYR1 homolog isoform X3 [Plutella xylostella]XP_048481231.1 putative oxidoreductase GLYR1 homolog isoform X4 [Plutella xylostella]
MSIEYKLGDLVWAKMKGFSPWPGRVAVPTAELKPPKKAINVQCIYFFGTNNYAWIETNNIKPYQEFKEQLIKSCKTAAFKEAVAQIEDYMVNPEKYGDIDGPTRDTEQDFDNLKNMMEEEPEEPAEQENEVKKKGTPKIRLAISKVKPIKRSSSAGVKSVPRKKTKSSSLSKSFTDSDLAMEKPSMLNHSFSKKSSLLHRPSNILRPDTPPLDLENVSETLLEKNIQASQMTFGFLGLGIMGSGIVKNLLNSGHKVVVWNRTAAKCKDFEKVGATIAVTPCDVVEEADITFSCVADPQAAKEMVFGNCGVLHCASLEQKGYVEMTSIDADTSHDIVEAVGAKGGRYLEAQIQGSKTQAEEGTLILLAAGDRSLFDDCQSCFKAMSKNSFYLGDIGNASKMNSVLQVVGGVSLAALAEGLALADRAGLSQADLLDVLALTPLASPHLILKGRAMIESSYSTHQPLTHMQKDLKLALGLGDALEQSLPLTATTNEIFKHAKRLGYASHDVSAVYIRARF